MAPRIANKIVYVNNLAQCRAYILNAEKNVSY